MLHSVSMEAEKNLQALGLTLPDLPTPGGNYLPAKRIGSLLYLSGVTSSDPRGIVQGTVGSHASLHRSIDDGYQAARLCALTQLAVIRRELGSLDRVAEVVSVNGYVNAAPGFSDPPKVINGASDLLIAVFGEAGRHVRAAIGVSALPGNALVELQMVVAVADHD